MRIISLNPDTENIEVFHITDEFVKWCIDHNVGDEEFEEPECFNDFMTDFFRQLGYTNPELKTFMRVEDGTTVNIMEMYPDEHIEDILSI